MSPQKKAPERPVGFLSYAHFDDEHNKGWITEFRKGLSGEVQAQTAKKFTIFQDRGELKWGENWEDRIDGALRAATFFFPIITPSFLDSKECKKEFRDFLKHEKARKRKDLVFPVYYIPCQDMVEGKCRKGLGTLIAAIKAHQYYDVTDLRFEPLDNLKMRKLLADMAKETADAIDRITKAK